MRSRNVLFLLLYVTTCTVCHGLGDSWLIGCFRGVPADIRTPETWQPLVPCARGCLNAQGALVGMGKGDRCICLGSTAGLEKVDDQTCTRRCSSVSRNIRLYCGGYDDDGESDVDDLWSVYTSAGPYLLNVTAGVSSRWVVPDLPVALEATAHLAGFVNLTADSVWDSEDGCSGSLRFEWNVEGAIEEVESATCGPVTCAHVPFTFLLTGNFSIEVTVSNVVSKVQTSFVVTVVTPRPRGLQLLPRHPAPRHLPSCLHPHLSSLHPSPPSPTAPASPTGPVSRGRAAEHPASNAAAVVDDDGDNGTAVVAVFANASFHLEVGVGVGQDLTYVITVTEVARQKKRKKVFSRDVVRATRDGYEYGKGTPEGTAVCVREDCQELLQTLVFSDPGQYRVHVNVSNHYGWEDQNLTVVVMQRNLGDVQFYLRDGEASALPTFHTVTFHLTLVTADRHNTLLHVDFADGHVKFAPLREQKNGTDLLEGHADDGEEAHFGTVLRGYGDEGQHAVEEPITGLRLVASYGHGCQLVVVFEHTYQTEGTYLPHVWIRNNVTDAIVTEALTSPIVVQNQLSGAKIQAPSAVAVGTRTDFFFHLLRSSVGLRVNWVVRDDSDDILTNFTTPATKYSTVFWETGVYKITARAWNLLDQVEAAATVVVQRAVENLTLHCQPSPPHLRVEEDLNCLAEVSQGSHVTFTWNFQDAGVQPEVQNSNLSSHASHIYLQPGTYNVSVMATNQVSRLVATLPPVVRVDTTIRCLQAVTTAPALPGEEVFMEATALSGTSVRFQFDFGPGWRTHDGYTEVERTRTKAVTSHKYRRLGINPVTVFARNAVSSAFLKTYIEVQPPVGSVEVVLQPSSSNSDVAVLVVQQHGEVVRRQDLLFFLRVSDSHSIVSRSPVLEVNVSRATSQTVNLTAFNGVGSVNVEIHVDDANLSVQYRKPHVVHPAVVSFERSHTGTQDASLVVDHQPVQFELLNIPSKARVLEVTYSDGNRVRKSARAGRWSHVFTSPGVHTVEVSIYGGGRGGARRLGPPLHSTLVLQQPIRGLRLTGPSHVGIHCYNVWEAELSRGSHFVCQWSLGGEPESGYTTTLTHTRGFEEEGVYTLGILCHNDVSSLSATLNVTVNHPVANVHLHIPATVLGRPSLVKTTVSAGRYFSLEVDYGDGTKEEYLSTQLSLVSANTWLPSFREAAPAYNVTLKHVYAEIGVYNVRVTVYNPSNPSRDSVTRLKQAVVEEAIANITLFTDATDIVPLTDQVTVTAVVASGKDLKFDWDFSVVRKPLVESFGNTSIAKHTFGLVGRYPVTVKVSNHLQETVVARLPFPIEVQDPVSSISVKQLGPRGANFSLHTNRSDPVTFTATSDGEPVTYTFDFGDGTTETVQGALNMFQIMIVKVTHIYDKEGVYNVTVVASNALGNATGYLPEPLYVQVPVQGPLLIPMRKYCTQFGQDTVFHANLPQGTNVTFTWRLDDETELVDVDNIVQHKYRERGVATIQVTASNEVSSVTDYADVDVVEQIQSVSVSVPSLVVAAGQPMNYTAIVTPEHQGQTTRYYTWDFGRRNEPIYKPQVTYTYQYSGRFLVTVTAHNCHSNATSVPISIHVVACLVDVHIETVGDNLVNQPIKFLTRSYEGDFLNFTWNFGDGTPLMHTERSDIWHTFNRTGEYVVSVLVENPLSRDTATLRVFILTQLCKPPSVSIVGLIRQPVTRSGSGQCQVPWPVHSWCKCYNETRQQTYIKQMSRQQTLRVESQVSVNCSITSDVTYTWQLEEEGTEWDEYWWARSKGLDPELLHHPTLVLPPSALPSASRFAVKLKVCMNGTEIPVYQMSKVHIHVDKSPLESIIRGGVLRRVSRHDNITLDGSRSRDPDNSSAILSFKWDCHLLKYPDHSCFNMTKEESLPPFNTSQLTFPGSWLSLVEDDFLFNLTVASSDMAPAVAEQVLSMTPRPQVIPVAVECRQCHREWVNSNNKLSLVAHCMDDTCSDLRLRYSWEVFFVASDSPENDHDSTIDVHSACVAADGSSYLRQMLANTTTTTPTTTTVVTTTPTTTPVTTTAAVPGSRVLPGVPSQPRDVFSPWQNVQEIHGPSSRMETFHRGQSSRTMGRVPPEFNHDLPLDIGEGIAGDSGSAQGRKIGLGKSEPLPPVEAAPCAEGDVDCRQFNQPKQAPSHITTKSRYPVFLDPSQVASDPHGPSLVLRPGTLKQGWTYLVQVTVSSPDLPEAEGVAMTYFKVNKSPRKGVCHVQPQAGVEMDTLFRVFCNQWQDEQLPVWYEVSYSLEGDELGDTSSVSHNSPHTSSVHRRHVIYRGLRHKVTFRLPAGLPSNGHQVLLHLAIQDDWGAATTICHINIPVTPQQQQQQHQQQPAQQPGRSLVPSRGPTDNEKALNNEVSNLSAHLSTSVYRGDVTGIQDSFEVLCHLATRLNRLPDVIISDSSSNNNNNSAAIAVQQRRADIRARLVSALQAIPMRDEVELIKTLHCLLTVTSVVSQVDGLVLVYGVQLLESVRRHAAAVYGDGQGVSGDLVGLTVQVVSNLMQASTQGLLLKSYPEDSRHRLTQRAVRVLDGLVTLSLYDHSLGEMPVRHAADFITLAASHYHSHDPTSITVGTTTFKLPLHMTPVLRAAVPKDAKGLEERDCFQARAAAYQHNPYAYSDDQQSQVQSEVVSLDMFTCGGEEKLAVKNLSPDNNVEIVLPVTTPVETVTEYQMSRDQMSIHHFNVSQSQVDLYLTLVVNLSAIPAGHTPFPITAVISETWPPHPQHNMYRKDFPSDAQQLHIFFPPGSLSDAGSYYLGLIETSLNLGRRRKTEVMTRNYTLSAWFRSCLFWNESIKTWSERGCHVANTLAPTTTAHCRCNHLTAFGSHFELIPNDLSFTDLEHFFSPHENPVVLILIGMVLLVYFLLLILARRADNHDMRKGGMVCLTDNNVMDTQLYEIIVQTGLRQNSPTTAKISLILHGEYGMSETRELISEDDRPMFERSSRDRFLLTLPDSLGRIQKVQLWHNNAGASPRWFLGQVIVRDLNTGKATYFLCDKWFAVDEGDGKVEREVVAVDNVSFLQILISKGREYLADYHLWTSVFTCPPHTRFTRAQRLTCCLTLLLSYMALNATWYQQQPEQRRGEFGLLDLSWRSITVGAICCAVIFPLHLFLAFLFRCSKSSHWPCHRKVDASSRPSTTGSPIMAYAAVSENTGSNNGGGVDVTDTLTTYSLLDQSILNWQSIQDWAQRQWVKRQQNTRSSDNSAKNNSQPPSQPPAQPVQHTLLAEEETDQASSGFEDAVSQATAERNRIRATSDSSSEEQRSHFGDGEGGSRQIYLPSWCRYIAWVLCALISVTSATITILYGFRFGPVKSTYWLQSLYFSFMVCIFLAQPVWILATVIWVAVWNRNNPAVLEPSNHGDARSAMDVWHSHQKHVLDHSEEGGELERGVRARQRSRYLRFARPPQEKALQESRKKLVKERNAANFLREVSVFVLMFTLVCIMAYGKDLSPHYRLNHSVCTVLLRGSEMDFEAVNGVSDWHLWAQTTLLDAVYGTNSTPGLIIQNGEAQSNTIIIGHPLLRQLRVPSQPCQAMPYITHTAPCYLGYGDHSNDHESMGDNYTWAGAPPGGSMVWGQHAVYEAGGFAAPLNYTSKEEAVLALSQLEQDGWIDRNTRAVILEITLLSVPTNLFCAVQLLLELPPSGGIFPLAKITSTSLFRYVSAWDNCILACELLFVLLALVRTQSELTAIVQQGSSYFSWPWNYTKLLMCLVSLAYVGCYIYRFILVNEAVEFLRSTFYEQFFSLTFLTTWDELLRSLVGMLVFLVVVTQGLQLIRYCPHLAKFAAVYRRARREIMLLLVMFVVITVAYSSLGWTLFVTASYSMRSFWSSALSFTALATGIYSPPDVQGAGDPWYNMLALFFTIFGAGLLTAYMVAVLTYRLRVYKSSDVLVMGKCELLDYTLQQLLLLTGFRKLTPVHEPEVDLPPECTLAEFEYQVEELLFRMNALAGTTNLPEKPAGYLTDSDQSQANGDDGISSGGSEPQVERSGAVMRLEGEGRLEQRVQKIEDKLYANEPYLAQLLKLDSIGADILSQEKEKQLRSHLEMEIFRQLQMRRQETGNPTVALDTLPITTSAITTTAVTASKPTNMIAANSHNHHLLHTGPEPWPQHKGQTGFRGHDKGQGHGMSERGHAVLDRTQHKREEMGERNAVKKSVFTGEADSSKQAGLHPGLSSDSPGSETACLLRQSDSSGNETACLLSSGDDQDCLRNISHKGGVGTKTGKGYLGGLSVITSPSEFDGGRHKDPEASVPLLLASKRHTIDDCSSSSHRQGSSKTHPADIPVALERTSSLRNAGKRHGGAEGIHAVGKTRPTDGLERADSLRLGKKIHADLIGMERSDSLRGASRKHPVDPTMERSDSLRVRKHPELAPSGMERADSLRVRKLPADLTASVMERSDSLRSAGRKPELPPKPTFAQAVLPSLESRRSPKPPPLKIPTERVLHRAEPGGWGGRGDPGGSGLLGESSSGSEPDAALGIGPAPSGSSRRSQGQTRRNLRKTKSRGKGKGAGTLTPTLLLDELSFTVHEPPRDLAVPADLTDDHEGQP